MRIPLVDLNAQHREFQDEIETGWRRVLEQTSFILGPEVRAFEEEFASFCSVRHCIGVASGTDAIELALRAIGVGSGDEVILPANTFVATALAVVRTGAVPVLVDVTAATHLIDVAQVVEAITSHTRATLPVHLFGQVAPMAELTAVARDHGIAIVEDAAQAHGAKQGDTLAGGFGALAGTSFYPGKNLGAYGDAGAVLTNDESLARRVRALRNYGSDVKYHHPELGFNSRLDTLQAVVLSAKLRRLASWNDARRAAAARYDDLLSDVTSVSLPITAAGNEHVWHLYVVRVAERDRVLEDLRAAGVEAGVHYPIPIHLQEAFRWLGKGPGSFPETERAANEILSLPLFPGITAEQQATVAGVLRKSAASSGSGFDGDSAVVPAEGLLESSQRRPS